MASQLFIYGFTIIYYSMGDVVILAPGLANRYFYITRIHSMRKIFLKAAAVFVNWSNCVKGINIFTIPPDRKYQN